MRIDVRLDLTEPLRFAPPPRLPLNVTLWPRSVKFALSGKYRQPFAEALAAGAYDYYLAVEDDAGASHPRQAAAVPPATPIASRG